MKKTIVPLADIGVTTDHFYKILKLEKDFVQYRQEHVIFLSHLSNGYIEFSLGKRPRGLIFIDSFILKIIFDERNIIYVYEFLTNAIAIPIWETHPEKLPWLLPIIAEFVHECAAICAEEFDVTISGEDNILNITKLYELAFH